MGSTFAGRPIFKPLGTLAALTVTGLASLLGGFYSSGNSTIGGTLILRSLYATSTSASSPSIYASGTSIFNDVTISGTCTGCGGGSLSGGIADSVTFWNSSSAVGASSSLTYSSSTGLFSNLGTVSSTAINTGNITAKTNNLFDLGAFGSAWKDVYSSGTILATAIQNVGTLTQSGSANFTGAVTITNLTTFNGNATPGTNNSRDIGSVTTAWKDVYASGTIRTNGGIQSNGVIQPYANNTTDLGAFGTAWRDFYSSGTARLATLSISGTSSFTGQATYQNQTNFGGNILPTTNNIRDIGSFGSAWRDVYSSGTANLGTLSADGNITLGDSSTDNITLNARFASTLNPNANNTIDVGTYGTAFKDIYASGTVRFGTATAGLTIVGNALSTTSGAAGGSITFNPGSGGNVRPAAAGTNSFDLGTNGAAWRNINASTSVRVAVGAASTTVASTGFFTTGGFFSSANNTSDIGAMGNAMKDVYASGSNIFVTGLGATGAGDVNVCWTTAGKLTQGATCGVSSGYYKEHIRLMKAEEVLKKAAMLRAVTYDYKTGMGADDEKKEIGYIAEEVANIDQTLVVWAEPTPEHLEWTEKNWPSLVKIKDGKKYVPNGVLYERIAVLQGAAFQAYMEKTDKKIDALTTSVDAQEKLLTKLYKIIEKIIAKLRM